MKKFITKSFFILIGAGVILSLAVCGFSNSDKLTDAQGNELMAMIHTINRRSLPYKAAVMQRMLIEANYYADRLQLPVPHPIRMDDIRNPWVAGQWYSVINETNFPYLPDTIYGRDICNTNIPRDERISALKIGVRGTFETTNFFFSFGEGKLLEVMRISHHTVERYADNLDALIGKPSLIDTNGAYQLATQWLAAVDIDMTALNKLKWTVNQLHYRARGATNYVTLPLYYVDFGEKHFHWPKGSPMKDHPEPLASVEILGTTKELQDLTIANDPSLSRRPPMLITNILALVRTPNPPSKQLQSRGAQTNSSSP